MEVIHLIIHKIRSLVKDYGARRIFSYLLVIVFCILLILFLCNQYVDVQVISGQAFGDIVDKEENWIVIRNGKIEDGISVTDITKELMSENNKQMEIVSTFMELKEKCDNAVQKEKTITIPVKSVKCDYGDVAVYSWTKKSKSLMSYILDLDERVEKFIILRLCDEYILARLEKETFSFSISVEVGTIVNY